MTNARLAIERKGAKQRESLWNRVMGGPKKKAHRSSHRAIATTTGVRDDVASALVNLGYQKPAAKAAALSASGNDFESIFRSAMGTMKRKNPRNFPGDLTAQQISALRKLARLAPMAQKKKSRKKKKNSRKGTMPAGLKAYWAKKRAAKRKRSNPKKRRAVRRKPVSLRVKKYRRAAPKVKRRRARKANPRRKAHAVRIKAPYGVSGKALRAFAAMARKAYGAPARIVNR